MKTKAIIFDKDGTLLDFDSFWVSVSQRAIHDALKELGAEKVPVREILEAFGVFDGVTDIDCALCKGTYQELGEIMYGILEKYGVAVSPENTVSAVMKAYNCNSNEGIVKPTCPQLKEVLTELKKHNMKLAVVTTDNEPITHKCLKDLGIEDLFDKIYTDNGIYPPKPDPYCAIDFCSMMGAEKDEAVMVGDTLTDVKFARNAGIKVVGVAGKEKAKELLTPNADQVIPDLSYLLGVLD